MLPWEEPQVIHPCGSAGQCFPTLIRSNRKKKKKRERDKQLILEVVLVTVLDSILKIRLSQMKQSASVSPR